MPEKKLVDKISRVKKDLEDKIKELEKSELEKSIIDKKVGVPEGLENFAYDITHNGKIIYENKNN